MREQLKDDNHTKEIYLGLWSFLREVVAKGNIENVKKFMNADLFPLLMKMAQAVDIPELMIECTWILTNITSVDDKDIIYETLDPKYGVLDYLCEMAKYDKDKIREHAFWWFANYCGEEDQDLLRTLVNDKNIIQIINDQNNEEKLKLGIARTTAWLSSNLVKYKEKDEAFVKAMADCLSTFAFIPDYDISLDAAHGFYHLTLDMYCPSEELMNLTVNYIGTLFIIPKFVEWLSDSNHRISIITKTIGNLVTVTNEIVETQLIDAGIFEQVIYMLILSLD